jgi:hypothetical protein
MCREILIAISSTESKPARAGRLLLPEPPVKTTFKTFKLFKPFNPP